MITALLLLYFPIQKKLKKIYYPTIQRNEFRDGDIYVYCSYFSKDQAVKIKMIRGEKITSVAEKALLRK